MPASRPQRIAMIGQWALGAAMLTGLAQVVVLSTRHFVFGKFIWVSREYIWMVPAGYAIIFAAVGALLACLTAAMPSRIGMRVTGFVFGSLGALAVLLLFPQVYHLAWLIVALGIGSRVAGWGRRNEQGRAARLGKIGVVLALIFAVTSGAFTLARRWNERAAIRSLASAPPGAPNVLLIILDTVRGADMSFLGYSRETSPNLAKLGREGVIFEQAYATSSWTLPSHGGMFTGWYPSALSADWDKPLDGRQKTVAEIFRANGYLTAGFVANNYYASWESGLGRGFMHYDDYRVTPKQVLLSTTFFQTKLWLSIARHVSLSNVLRAFGRLDLRTLGIWYIDRKVAGTTTAQFLAWERSRSHRPFFTFINLFDAHAPYDPPPFWKRRFSPNPTAVDKYDGAIAYMDYEIRQLLDSLERRGVLESTVVVISSDHGESLGEHGLDEHGFSLYRTELYVPLIVRYPARVPAGVRVSEVVSLRDLAATLLDLAGVNAKGGLPGVSLGRAWIGPAGGGGRAISEVGAGINTAPQVPVSRGAMQSLIDDGAHYIRNGDGVEELYAWRSDPEETRDLARSAGAKPILDRLRLELSTARGRR
jgi:arylsulfatase A-like enzyme